jgi:L-fuculose-phosphate aldolase
MLDTICEVLKEAYSRNLITSRDGNASYRRKGENCLYITPSGTRKNVLTLAKEFLKNNLKEITSD